MRPYKCGPSLLEISGADRTCGHMHVADGIYAGMVGTWSTSKSALWFDSEAVNESLTVICIYTTALHMAILCP